MPRTPVIPPPAVASTSREPEDDTREVLTSLVAQIQTLTEGLASTQAQLAVTQASNVRLDQQLRARLAYDWKTKGNEIQFNFNTELINKATESLMHYEGADYAAAAACVTDLVRDLAYRNKLIKIADRAECGWDAATEYDRTAEASDEEDEKRIKHADASALAKRKRKLEKAPKKGVKHTKEVASEVAVWPQPGAQVMPPWAFYPQQMSGQMPATAPMMVAAPAAVAPVHTPGQIGPCFYCKGPHLRANCPILLAKKEALQQQNTE